MCYIILLDKFQFYGVSAESNNPSDRNQRFRPPPLTQGRLALGGNPSVTAMPCHLKVNWRSQERLAWAIHKGAFFNPYSILLLFHDSLLFQVFSGLGVGIASGCQRLQQRLCSGVQSIITAYFVAFQSLGFVL